MYTSGTTRRTKGALLTHLNLVMNATANAFDANPFRHDDVVMGCLPLFHVFGQTVSMNSTLVHVANMADIDAASLIEGMATVLPDVDRAVLTYEYGEDLAANFAAGLRTGVDGWVDDDFAFAVPWGFSPGRGRDADLCVAGQRGPDGAVRPRTNGFPRTSRVRRHDYSRARANCPSALVRSTA